jgi:hypothetical protein
MMEDLRLVQARKEVPNCDECKAFEENPKEYVKQEICPSCPWDREIQEPIVLKLINYLSLIDAGCPIGRHELLDTEWLLMGEIKSELLKLESEKREQERQRRGRHQ